MSTAGTNSFRGRIYDDITQTIGNTPLIRLRRVTRGCHADVVAKLESYNPLWSVKDRIGVAMIDAAEADGKIDKDTVIIEPTSGNTGIGLAFTCAARGYRLVVTMPESMSLGSDGCSRRSAPDRADPRGRGDAGSRPSGRGTGEEHPHAFMPQQFKNPANPEIHLRDGREVLARHRWQGGHPDQWSRDRRHHHRLRRGPQGPQAIDPDHRRRTGRLAGHHAVAAQGAALALPTQAPGGLGMASSRTSSTPRSSTRWSPSPRTNPSRWPAAWPARRACSAASPAGRPPSGPSRSPPDPRMPASSSSSSCPDLGERYLSTPLFPE